MPKRRAVFCYFFFLLILSGSPALATEAFSDYYNVTYKINPDGKTEVEQNISIVNNATDVYAADYTITIGSENITNIKAEDRLGSLTPEIVNGNGSTSIRVIFKDKVVGARRALNWTLRYEASDAAIHRGTAWEVTVPRLSFQPEIKSYDLNLIIPKSFGPEMYISPSQEKFTATGNENIYTFKKEFFENTGIMAAFGAAQRFNLELTYHLKNPSLLSSGVEIALLPDIFGEQRVEIENITPKPDSVTEDSDGNYLAKYPLLPREEKEIKLIAKVLLIHRKADLSKSGKIAEVPDNLRELYTQPAKFWESADPEIRTLAASIVQNDLSAAENARLLYQYVVSNLSYDWKAVQSGVGLLRKGAKAALQNKDRSVCMEYADLYIALLRAAGIPARRMAGYAFSQNIKTRPIPSDTLHTWVQVYLPKVGWISTDPTWGSTTNGLDYFSKLDANHIVFSINGKNSEFPFPAGTYKIIPEQQGDLKVSFIEDNNYFPAEPVLKVFQKENGLFLDNFPEGSGTAALGVEVRVNGAKNNRDEFLGTIPAFSRVKISDINFEAGTLPVNVTFKKFDGTLNSEDYLVELQPFGKAVIIRNWFYQILPLTLVLCMIGGILVLVPAFRKRLPGRPRFPPRAQDQ